MNTLHSSSLGCVKVQYLREWAIFDGLHSACDVIDKTETRGDYSPQLVRLLETDI